MGDELHWNEEGLHSDTIKEEKLDGITAEEGEAVIKLYLAKNELKTLPPELFDRFPNLQYLYLAHNQLETLPLNIKNLGDLRRLETMSNNFPEGGNKRAKNREEVEALLALLEKNGRLVEGKRTAAAAVAAAAASSSSSAPPQTTTTTATAADVDEQVEIESADRDKPPPETAKPPRGSDNGDDEGKKGCCVVQ